MIAGSPYKKKVQAPELVKVLKAPVGDQHGWSKVKYVAGKEVQKKKCKFIGYTKAVKDHEEIHKAYKHLRLLHGSARHIICVYRIAGNHPTCEDYDDDDEFSAGRHMLSAMVRNNIMNRVFFVV